MSAARATLSGPSVCAKRAVARRRASCDLRSAELLFVVRCIELASASALRRVLARPGGGLAASVEGSCSSGVASQSAMAFSRAAGLRRLFHLMRLAVVGLTSGAGPHDVSAAVLGEAGIDPDAVPQLGHAGIVVGLFGPDESDLEELADGF